MNSEKGGKNIAAQSRGSCFPSSSDGSLEDPADLIDPRLFPQFLTVYIVSDTDDLLQIFSGQAGKGTLFPDLSPHGNPRLAKDVVQRFYILR